MYGIVSIIKENLGEILLNLVDLEVWNQPIVSFASLYMTTLFIGIYK